MNITTESRKAELTALIEDAESQLSELEMQASKLRTKIPQAEASLKDMQSDLRQIVGDGWHGNRGQIGNTEGIIAGLSMELGDLDAVRVVWVASSSGYMSGNRDEYIVSRVTKKRIFIRSSGHSVETQFDKAGQPIGSYRKDTIDLTETFTGTEYAELFESLA